MTRLELDKMICDIFNIAEPTPLIQSQVRKFVVERRYSYLDVARALSYYVDVQNLKPDIRYGVFFIENVIKDAIKYFENLARQKEELEKLGETQLNKEKPIIYYQPNTQNTIRRHHISLKEIK